MNKEEFDYEYLEEWEISLKSYIKRKYPKCGYYNYIRCKSYKDIKPEEDDENEMAYDIVVIHLFEEELILSLEEPINTGVGVRLIRDIIFSIKQFNRNKIIGELGI